MESEIRKKGPIRRKKERTPDAYLHANIFPVEIKPFSTCTNETRRNQDKARQARQGKPSQAKPREGKAGQGKAREGKAMQDNISTDSECIS
jgi:hypothetical protein